MLQHFLELSQYFRDVKETTGGTLLTGSSPELTLIVDLDTIIYLDCYTRLKKKNCHSYTCNSAIDDGWSLP